MLFTQSAERSPSKLKLLIACQSSSEDRVRRALTRFAATRLEADGVVRILSIPDRERRNKTLVVGMINSAIRGCPSSLDVVILHGIDFEPRGHRMSVLYPHPTVEALEGRHLESILKKLELDWVAYTSMSLCKWMHGSITRESLSSWLQQFDIFGPYRWIGERLLRIFEFWAPERLADALSINVDGLQGYTHVCVVADVPGKSGSVLSSLVRKRAVAQGLAITEVEELSKTLAEDVAPGKVLLFEDGLFTGTEFVGVVQSLLGIRPPGRAPKAQTLANPSLLKACRIDVRFGRAANLGYHEVNKFLEVQGLHGISIQNSPETLLQTLTAAGVAAFSSGRLYREDTVGENLVDDVNKYIAGHAFSDGLVWRDHQQRQRAIEFCAAIGVQLWRRYLARTGWIWSEERILESALGVRGQALALAFAHSVPKGALPLFWVEGEVVLNGKSVQWQPLFPSAY